MTEKTLKEKLLREDDLTLKKTQDICLSFEETRKEVAEMSSGAKENPKDDVDSLKLEIENFMIRESVIYSQTKSEKNQETVLEI